MIKSPKMKFTGCPEHFVSVSNDAPADEWPIDEILCSVARADAVISMVMIFLSHEEGRPADTTLSDSLWSTQCDIELIRKLADHYNHGEISYTCRVADSVISLAVMALSETEREPADYLLYDQLWAAQTQLENIASMANREHIERSKSAA